MLNIPINVQLPLKPVVELLLKLDKEMGSTSLAHDSAASLQRVDDISRWPHDAALFMQPGTAQKLAFDSRRLSADAPVFTPSLVSPSAGIAEVSVQAEAPQCNQM